ncbi:CHAT domain-containing protein [Microcoleus sp.]|uniref:CHAT domain-containing protein n=1 Tax=Microcoleus sp. TaxID=44472 RepID=UPI0035267430
MSTLHESETTLKKFSSTVESAQKSVDQVEHLLEEYQTKIADVESAQKSVDQVEHLLEEYQTKIADVESAQKSVNQAENLLEEYQIQIADPLIQAAQKNANAIVCFGVGITSLAVEAAIDFFSESIDFFSESIDFFSDSSDNQAASKTKKDLNNVIEVSAVLLPLTEEEKTHSSKADELIKRANIILSLEQPQDLQSLIDRSKECLGEVKGILYEDFEQITTYQDYLQLLEYLEQALIQIDCAYNTSGNSGIGGSSGLGGNDGGNGGIGGSSGSGGNDGGNGGIGGSSGLGGNDGGNGGIGGSSGLGGNDGGNGGSGGDDSSAGDDGGGGGNNDNSFFSKLFEVVKNFCKTLANTCQAIVETLSVQLSQLEPAITVEAGGAIVIMAWSQQIKKWETSEYEITSKKPKQSSSEVKASSVKNDKLVIIKIEGDFEKGFPAVTVLVGQDGDIFKTQFTGQLPASPKIPKLYRLWQEKYNRLIEHKRMDADKNQPANFNYEDINKDVIFLADELLQYFKNWLNSDQFRPIQNQLRDKLNTSEELRVIIQSGTPLMWRLPWHLWDFVETRRKAGITLSLPRYDRIEKKAKALTRNKVRILSILGNNKGINISKDRDLLSNLDAEVVFMDKPKRKELDQQFWSAQGWDILCFSGHSSSEWDASNGWISINDHDKLTIADLKNSLSTAIEQGLQIAIFNSCDGLGLANQLASLNIPQIIVMREPVPDVVAQEFLKNFLTAFASGKSFYVAERQAREQLQCLEDVCPCATWLPVIFQNPAEVAQTWEEILSRAMRM